jgi:hypothetical protein
MVAWSYSSIKTFDQCPKKYYHLKVAKDVKDVAGDAARYGEEAHKAAEDYIKAGVPIPPKFKFMTPIVNSLEAIPGDKHAELKLGICKDGDEYSPCDFFDPDVWWRGVADLVIIRSNIAYLVDYKTGKNAKYADTKQLDLLAGAIFVHYPDVVRVKSALAYVVSNEFIHKDHIVANKNSYLDVFNRELDRLDGALASGVWNPNAGPLCGWCPVVECEHHRKR